MQEVKTQMFTFIIPGKPMGKQRPKFARMGNYVKTYTPKETVNYEQWVRFCFKEAGGKFMDYPYIEVDVDAYFPIPKSFSKKKRQEALDDNIKPTTKPDLDNILKVVTDALCGVAFSDDRIITQVSMYKQYAEEPRVEVTLLYVE